MKNFSRRLFQSFARSFTRSFARSFAATKLKGSLFAPSGAACLSHDIPPTLVAGKTYCFCLLLKNNGADTWRHEPENGAKLCLAVYVNDILYAMPESGRAVVQPGQHSTFFVTLRPSADTRTETLTLTFVLKSRAAEASEPNKSLLLSLTVNIAASPGPGIRRIRVAFNLESLWIKIRYKQAPLLLSLLQWKFQALRYRLAQKYNLGSRGASIDAWKRINKRLAGVEETLRRTKTHSLPQRLMIDTTSRCNLACRNCFRRYQPLNLNQEPDMQTVMVEYIIRNLFPTTEYLNITLSGEPLLSSHLERVLEAAARYRVKLSVTTNGMLLNDERLLANLLPNTANLEISLDSLEEKKLSYLRAGADLERIKANTARIVGLRRKMKLSDLRVGISMTLYTVNIDELPDIIHWLSTLGGDFVRTLFGAIHSKSHNHLLLTNEPEIFNKTRAKALKMAGDHGIQLSIPPEIRTTEKEQTTAASSPRPDALMTPMCDYLYQMMRINQYGEMESCLNKPIYKKKLRRDSDIHQKWNCREMQNIRSTYGSGDAPEQCRNCFIVQGSRLDTESLRDRFTIGVRKR